MIAAIISSFVIGGTIGFSIGVHIFSRKISKTIKDAKEQMEISRRLIEHSIQLERRTKNKQ